MLEKYRGRLTLKVILMFLSLGLLTAVSIGAIGYFQFTDTIEEIYNRESYRIANIIIDYIDVSNLEKAMSDIYNAETSEEREEAIKEVESTQEYKDLITFLNNIKRNEEIEEIYLADFKDRKENVSNQVTYFAGVNGSNEDPDTLKLGHTETYLDPNGRISTLYENGERLGFYLKSISNSGDTLMTALEPIINDNGQMVGIVSVSTTMSTLISARVNYLVTVGVNSFAIILLFIIIFIYLNQRSLLRPIDKIILAANKFAENGSNNIEELEEIQTHDEIEILASSIATLQEEITEQFESIEQMTKDKENIETEIKIASEIQSDILPRIFPAFPDKREFDVYALVEPAKEVRGDFYDLFLIDKDHLGFVIADVSGKGVPATLLMIITKTLLKDHAHLGESVSEIFNNVNDQLCKNNRPDVFVTAWMGILEISTGKLSYVNAGHNPPLLKKKDGKFELLSQKPDLVLAGLEDTKYVENTIYLNYGDKLFLYTDGVTEAHDPNKKLYGEKQLLKVLDQYSELSVFNLLEIVKEDISKFMDDAEQNDDIAMIGLEYKGNN